MTTEAMYATSSPVMVQPRQITRMALFVDGDALPDVDAREDGIHFLRPGWFEVLLTVEWDPQVAGAASRTPRSPTSTRCTARSSTPMR
jgi:hypothetical protein